MSGSPSPTALVKLLLPSTPLLLKTALWHSLSLSPESSKWDIKTTMLITTIRAILSRSTSSISRAQRLSLRDPGVKGNMWIAPVTLEPGEGDGVRQFLFDAVDELKTSPDDEYEECDLRPVEAEWTAYRADATAETPPPADKTPEQLYASLRAEASSPATILYFHGGAHYLMDPSSHRGSVSTLCKHAGGARALSVRYRLAPGNPFPTAILDCLVAYISLLYPPPGALHEPVDPKNVIFAGDSAGGNIALSLLTLLLHSQRQSLKSADTPQTLDFAGHKVYLPLPLPGGVATSSPWTDFTRSSPSLTTNAHYDYLPPPSVSLDCTTPAASAPQGRKPASETETETETPTKTEQTPSHTFTTTTVSTRAHQPGETPNPFPCALWARIPPRADLYTTGSMLAHPLVSPLIQPASAWNGAPPMFFLVGEEMLSDEGNCVARRCVEAGVPVRWEGWEAMPHCFGQVFAGAEIGGDVGRRSLGGWGEWIGAVGGGGGGGAGGESEVKREGGTWVAAKTLEESDVNVRTLAGHLSDEECWARMREEKRRRCEAYARLVEKEGGGGGGGQANGAARL